MFLHRGQDIIIRDLERRIADFTLIPVGVKFKIKTYKYLDLLFH